MLRPLFECLVGLHPRAFRRRFAPEMLSIFDHASGKRAALSLVGDAFISLIRQWVLRPGFWREPSPAEQPQMASAGARSFYIIENYRPSGVALLHGATLSLAVFLTITLAFIRTRGSQVQPWLPRIEAEKSEIPPAAQKAFRSTPVEFCLGRYVADGLHPATVDVTIEENQLYLTYPGSTKTALSPCSGSTFKDSGSSGCQISFSKFDRGKFQQLDIGQSGRHLTAFRLHE
jgi:hypothetical protein